MELLGHLRLQFGKVIPIFKQVFTEFDKSRDIFQDS